MPRKKTTWTNNKAPTMCEGCLDYNPDAYGGKQPCAKHIKFRVLDLQVCRTKRTN